MAKCRRSHKRFDSINVIPFIDIMLVLLVIVLTTATFIKQGVIPVDLPQAKASAKEDKKEEITIYVKQNGDIYIDKDKVSVQELEKRVSSLSKKQVVVLRSDKEAKFQDFVTIMDILKRFDHEQMYIVTKEEGQ